MNRHLQGSVGTSAMNGGVSCTGGWDHFCEMRVQMGPEELNFQFIDPPGRTHCRGAGFGPSLLGGALLTNTRAWHADDWGRMSHFVK